MNKLKVSLRGEVPPFKASLKVYFMMLNLPRCFQHLRILMQLLRTGRGNGV